MRYEAIVKAGISKSEGINEQFRLGIICEITKTEKLRKVKKLVLDLLR